MAKQIYDMMINSIELLNGVKWSVAELKSRMDDNDFYYGYCGKHMFSSSKIKNMSSSIKSTYYIQKYASEQALRDGWLFHTAILEPHVFDNLIFSTTLTKGVNFKKLVEYHGSNNVFSLKEKQDAERLQDAFQKNEKAMSFLRNSDFEVPAVGVINGYPFRGKADVLQNNGRIIDLKTTLNVKFFKQDSKKLGYDIQCYIYCELFNISYENFYFVAIDKRTLDIGIFNCSREFYESGRFKTLNALKVYKKEFDGKSQEQILDFINNIYLEDTL